VYGGVRERCKRDLGQGRVAVFVWKWCLHPPAVSPDVFLLALLFVLLPEMLFLSF
jgi:hypothetical protein